MACVARAVAVRQQKKTNHYKGLPLGILNLKEAAEMIDIFERLQRIEFALYEFLKCRAETEKELEAKGIAMDNEDLEKRNRMTQSLKIPRKSHAAAKSPVFHSDIINDKSHPQQATFKSKRNSMQQSGPNVAESIKDDVASDSDSVESKAKTSDRNIHSSSKQKRGNRCLKLKQNFGFG